MGQKKIVQDNICQTKSTFMLNNYIKKLQNVHCRDGLSSRKRMFEMHDKFSLFLATWYTKKMFLLAPFEEKYSWIKNTII